MTKPTVNKEAIRELLAEVDRVLDTFEAAERGLRPAVDWHKPDRTVLPNERRGKPTEGGGSPHEQ